MKSRRKATSILIFILIAFLIGFWMDRSAQRAIEETAMRTLETYIQRYADRTELRAEEIAQIDQDAHTHNYYLHIRNGDQILFSNAKELVRETPSPGTGVSVYRSKHLNARVVVVRSELGRGAMRLYQPLQLDWPISIWIPAVTSILFLLLIREYLEEKACKREWEAVSRRVREEEPLLNWEQMPSHAGPLMAAIDRRLESSKEKSRSMSVDNVQIEAILHSVETGVVALDEELRVFLINPAAARLLHISRDEALGKDVLLLFRDNDFDDALEHYRTSGILPSEPFPIRFAGRDLSIRLSTTLFSALESGLTLAIEDTTELNKLLTMRREFISNVSHELRTPLTSIKGFTETLMTLDVDPENSKRFLRILDSEVDRLEKLVSDLEILSSIEKYEDLQEREESFYPSEVLEEERESLQALVTRANNIELTMDIEPSTRPAFGRTNLFLQLVHNLCENAVKYSKPEGGKVTIRLQEEGFRGILEVEDTGIGIPDKDIERIFERFYMVDRSRSLNVPGTGLGLAIVKHIAITFGGEVQVQSKLGEGSRFIFYFPLSEFTRI
ncbi:MAG TPA: PAS domain-containing protein [Tissierellia bacterium]|nr:PAS domain-containing protein [Tissierellia bacterium]